ncbi:hypothetical protein GGR10_001417, partial [Bartonella chomelii]|nr:hypothetical protein [Bartonella chomelii]
MNVTGGKAELMDVRISEFETGVRVTSGKFEMTKGMITVRGSVGSSGVEVRGGTAELMGNATIMVTGSGTMGVKVEKGEFKMTKGMITGSGGYGVSMTGGNVTLDGGVKITGFETGVKVTKGEFKMTGGEITGGGRDGYGVSMTGGTVTLEEVTVTGKGSGGGSMGVVKVQKGTFKMTGGMITVTGNGQGVYVMDGGSVVTLDGVKITGSGSYGVMGTRGTFKMTGGSITGFTTGVNVVDNLTMIGGSITGNGKGQGVTGSGRMRLEGGVTITGFETGVNAEGSESLTIRGGTITGLGSGTGVTGSGRMVLERVKISQFATGVKVEKGKSLMMTGGEIEGNGSGTGVNVMDGGDKGEVMLNGGVRITGFETGVSAEGSESLTMKDVTITGNGRGGYGVTGSGTVRLERVTISKVGMGVRVEKGKSLMMTGGSVTEFTEKGVYVGSGVTSAELTGTRITGKGSGSTGVYAVGGENLVMRLDDVTVEGVQMGVYVKRGKSLTIRGGTITGLGRGGYGVSMTDGNVTLENVTVSQFATGVNAGSGSLTMTGGSITGNGKGGYGVTGGNVTLNGGVKISKVGMGVMAGESLTMKDVTITGLGGGGSYGVTGGGTVRLDGGVEISGFTTGVKAEGRTLIMKDGSVTEFTEKGVDVGSGVESAELTRTVITGQDKGVGVYAVGGENLVM